MSWQGTVAWDILHGAGFTLGELKAVHAYLEFALTLEQSGDDTYRPHLMDADIAWTSEKMQAIETMMVTLNEWPAT